MFGKKKKEEKKELISPFQGEIHVIPDKFYNPGSIKSKKNLFFLLILSLSLISFLAAGSMIFLWRLGKKTTVNTNVVPSVQVNFNKNGNLNNNLNNSNFNSNLNENINTGINLNQNINAVPLLLPDSLDTDNDGLTDEEERVYQTVNNQPDSDSDSYVDGLEVISLYNPGGKTPVKIEESKLVKTFINPNFGYTIFYPSSWIKGNLDQQEADVLFTSATGEFIQVIVEKNSQKLAALDWYLSENPSLTASQVGTVVTKSGLAGVLSIDGLTAYLADQQYIYVIAYNIGNKKELNFKTTFNMMVKSFKLN